MFLISFEKDWHRLMVITPFKLYFILFGGGDHVTVTGYVRSGRGYWNEFQTDNGPLTRISIVKFAYITPIPYSRPIVITVLQTLFFSCVRKIEVYFYRLIGKPMTVIYRPLPEVPFSSHCIFPHLKLKSKTSNIVVKDTLPVYQP